jgi:hypothetical protein
MNKLLIKIRKINKPKLGVVLRFIEIIVLIVGLYLVIVQISDSRKVSSGQIALDMGRDIYSNERYKNNPQIIKLIQRHQPILVSNGGSIEEEDLDNLLGEWDSISNFNQLGILPDDLVYKEFSFDIEEAYNNKEIRDYIKRIRKDYNDDSLYSDFEWLAKWVDETSNKK